MQQAFKKKRPGRNQEEGTEGIVVYMENYTKKHVREEAAGGYRKDFSREYNRSP